MKILVTGGSGFVGRNLIPRLWDSHEIINLDIAGMDDPLFNSKVTTVLADMTDFSSLQKALGEHMKGVDVVVHLAALSREAQSNTMPDDYFKVNVGGTYNLLRLAKANNIKKFVFASSFLIYGNHATDRITEQHTPQPSTVYAATKVAGEALVRSFGTQYGFDYVILRKGNIYGHKDTHKRIIDIMIDRAKKGEDVVLFGDKTLDFVHIDDAVKAYLAAIGLQGSGTFNVGSGKGMRLEDMANMIIGGLKSTSAIRKAGPVTGDSMHFVADLATTGNHLAYRPTGDVRNFILEKISDA